jgi:hypothetical protein
MAAPLLCESGAGVELAQPEAVANTTAQAAARRRGALSMESSLVRGGSVTATVDPL